MITVGRPVEEDVGEDTEEAVGEARNEVVDTPELLDEVGLGTMFSTRLNDCPLAKDTVAVMVTGTWFVGTVAISEVPSNTIQLTAGSETTPVGAAPTESP